MFALLIVGFLLVFHIRKKSNVSKSSFSVYLCFDSTQYALAECWLRWVQYLDAPTLDKDYVIFSNIVISTNKSSLSSKANKNGEIFY